jgi:16S rRNA (guanine527-N7)-methyltransferase
VSGQDSFAELLSIHAEGQTLDRLTRYAELVERWSGRHNLVRYSTRRELVERHIADALAASPHLGREGRLLDVGSGAGLPGVPLLAALPRWHGVLLEPRQKRWAFLRMVIRELGLEAEVERVRYQDFADDRRFEIVTSRALGGHDELLGWVRRRLAPAGEVLVWTTTDGAATLENQKGWRVLSSQLPGLDCGRLARLQPCFT